MPPRRRLEVVSVFLASPGDTAPERRMIRQILSDFDSMARRVGFTFDVTDWEDTGPDRGEPQDEINIVADTCDIWIGVLGSRWGTPTRDWSSGFEEEFERAQARQPYPPRV